VRLVEDGQNKLERVSILNISAGGLLIRSTQPLAVGSHLQMRLLLPGVLPHLDTDGEVMWLTPSKDSAGRGYRLGVRFANLSQHEKDRIVKFIFGEQIKGKATQGRWGTQLAVR
jgi:c-di-GMP-binding flagellar brake protein YcgR